MARYDHVLNGVSTAWSRFLKGPPSPPDSRYLFDDPRLSQYPFLAASLPKSYVGKLSQSSQSSQGYGDNRPYSYVSYYDRQFRGDQAGNTDRYSQYSKDPRLSGGMTVNGDPSNARGLEGVKRWDGLIKQVSGETGVPWQVIAAIMGIESGGNPNAQSGAGAMGLMQVMPFHFTAGDNPFDPYTNVRKGAQILRSNFDRYGSWDRAVNAYFTGQPDPRGASDGGIDDYGYLNLFHNNLAALGYGQQASGSGNGWAVTGGVRYQMTQGFGHGETDPSVRHYYRGGAHTGLDFATPYGTPLFTPTGGTVVWAGDRGDGYGNSVLIWNGNHYVLLAHLSAITVQQGQQLNANAYIGRSGGTGPGAGKSTGNHLHFEVRDANNNPVDPRHYYGFN
ncbi:M23 family metallopeptidase [Nitrolancea hollandica]|uniref:Peptidase M23 n=1 Tax=Nitrolancea hollandica Lb TaxID=1129897 RepID=I4EL53_9BACT|nr:M23 family metallopeptidase [Nitrolancea hollandica]CCF85415.1 hypothetical protein NITHO_4940002 [Nitrolancea hollandica Lb]